MVTTTQAGGAPKALPAPLRQVITNLADLHIDDWLGQDFAIDIETTGLSYIDDKILGISISLADERSYYIVLQHTVPTPTTTGVLGELGDTFYITETFCPRTHTLKRLTRLFVQEDVVMVAHNLKFELHFLRRAGVEIRCQLADTMLAAQLVDENRQVGLKTLGSLVGMDMQTYQAMEHYPGFKKEEILGVPLEQVAQYAMDDALATLRLWNRLQEDMQHEGVFEAFAEIWMPCLVVLQEMEAKGIALDMEKVKQARIIYEDRLEGAEHAIWRDGIEMVLDRVRTADDWTLLPAALLKPLVDVQHLGTEEGATFRVRDTDLPILRKERKSFRPRVPWFNPGSSEQIKQLLFAWHGLVLPDDIDFKRNKDGEVGCDKDTLKVLAYELGDAAPSVLKDILEHRKVSKMLSTYFDTYRDKSDPTDHHCLRTSFNQCSTDTGRLSSSRPNLQNQSARGEEGKVVRSLFVARPGYQLVVADYSMMELRLAAHFSEDAEMCRAFTEGLDLHSLTAAGQMGLDYDDFTQRLEDGDTACKRARFIGKTSNFGLLYGMGAKKFQRYLLVENGVKVSLAEAQVLIESFNTTYSGIQRWKRSVSSYVKANGFVWTLGGRKRRLPAVNSLDTVASSMAHRQAINARVQGSCADIINGVMPEAQERLRELGGYLLLQVHDELVAEVPEEFAKYAAKVVERVMTAPNEKYNLRVPLVAEAGIGESWWSAK